MDKFHVHIPNLTWHPLFLLSLYMQCVEYSMFSSTFMTIVCLCLAVAFLLRVLCLRRRFARNSHQTSRCREELTSLHSRRRMLPKCLRHPHTLEQTMLTTRWSSMCSSAVRMVMLFTYCNFLVLTIMILWSKLISHSNVL